MLLRSLFYSSRLEILTSKRLTSMLYGIFGIAILLEWIAATVQFVVAYYTLGEFDVPAHEFIIITLVAFVPLWALGAFMLRTLLQRIRLVYWFKRQVNIPLYASQLKPAEAGLLVDYEFSLEEVHATLLDLHFRQEINLSIAGNNLVIVKRPPHNLNDYEHTLANGLFSPSRQTITLNYQNDRRLINAGKKAHEVLISSLDAPRAITISANAALVLRGVARLVFTFGGLIGLLLAYAYVFHHQEVTSIIFPRYPVEPLELWVLLAANALGAAVIISGLWPRFDASSKGSQSTRWLQAAGFKQYLSAVFAGRLSEQHVQTQQPETIRTYVPYLVAFKLIPLTPQYLRSILQTTDS